MDEELEKMFELILHVIICEHHPYSTCWFNKIIGDTNSGYTDCYKSHRVSAMEYLMEYKE